MVEIVLPVGALCFWDRLGVGASWSYGASVILRRGKPLYYTSAFRWIYSSHNQSHYHSFEIFDYRELAHMILLLGISVFF